MKMVKHQDTGVKSNRVAIAYLIQQGLESMVLLFVLINLLPLVTSADDMVIKPSREPQQKAASFFYGNNRKTSNRSQRGVTCRWHLAEMIVWRPLPDWICPTSTDPQRCRRSVD